MASASAAAASCSRKARSENICASSEDLQMLLGRLFGHQQNEQEMHRLAVRRVELHRRGQPQEGADHRSSAP